jgi:hypothetical protein
MKIEEMPANCSGHFFTDGSTYGGQNGYGIRR